MSNKGKLIMEVINHCFLYLVKGKLDFIKSVLTISVIQCNKND